MDLMNKMTALLSKYRYALLILAVGVGLMLIPGKDATTSEPLSAVQETRVPLTAEQRLEELLSSVKGAGKVQVLLSTASGEKTTYQTDTDSASGSNGTSYRSDTVTVTDQNRNQTGLIVQVDPPVYLGAVIVCQGADDPSVKLAVVEAVSKFTGLGANQISVLKMK